MPTTFCKSSYFVQNMFETPVLPDAKLGFLDGLAPPAFEAGGAFFYRKSFRYSSTDRVISREKSELYFRAQKARM